jgi:hypothetical protein
MKTIQTISGMLLLTALLISAQKECNVKDLHGVEGSLTSTNKYCGGARPTEEILSSYATQRPLAGKKLFVKTGTENDLNQKAIAAVETDAEGNFTLTLPPGKYILVDSERENDIFCKKLLKDYAEKTENYKPIDKECLLEWSKMPLMTFEVVDKTVTLDNLNILIGCSWDKIPCAQYVGPYPP